MFMNCNCKYKELNYGNCGIVRFRGKEAYVKSRGLTLFGHSVLISCQRLEVDPQAYLLEVLKRNTLILGEEELSTLTPKSWKKARQS